MNSEITDKMIDNNQTVKKQCQHKVEIGLTDWTFNCLKEEGHHGPHRIGISSHFYLAENEPDLYGFGSVNDLVDIIKKCHNII